MNAIFTPFLFLALLIIIPVALFVLPTLIAYLIYKKWLKKNHKKIGLVFVAIVVMGTLYITYTAFYPSARFYRGEFQDSTNLKLPQEAKFVKKDASYPDIHGIYCSAALVELSQASYSSLLNSFQADKSFALIALEDHRTKVVENSPLEKVEPLNGSYAFEFLKSLYEDIGGSPIEMYSYVAFLPDGKSLLFNHCEQ